MNGIKAVVFDFDGTLYDKKGMGTKVILRNVRHLRMLSATRKACTSFRGKYFGSKDKLFSKLFAQIAEKTGVTPKEAENWYCESYIGSMIRILRKYYKLRPKSKEVIEELHKRGITVILYSDYGMCEERVAAIGGNLSDFDKLYSSSEFGGLKPSEKAFNKMLSENGFSAGEVLIVGDSEECDGECARRSGAKFFPIKTDEDMEKLFEFIKCRSAVTEEKQ